MAEAKRFFIYPRKSTDVEDKQVRSIDAQISELNELAKRKALHVVDVIIERASAKTPGSRPQFNAMLARIEKGEADGILAWHPDRLARNMTDGGRIIDLIDTGKLVSLQFPTFWFEPTPQGKFMLAMAFSQSKYYVDSLAENTRRGLREKVRRGEFPGVAPIGYLNDRRAKRIVVDPDRAPVVKAMFERYAAGTHTIDDLRLFLAKNGIRSRTGIPVPNTTVAHMLKNPLFYGHFRYAGDISEGSHEAIITKAVFDRVQAVLAKRWRYSPLTAEKPHRAFLGLFRCGECGYSVTAEVQKGHTYYRCTKKGKTTHCSQPYVREESIDGEVSRLLGPFGLREDWADEMLRWLEAEREHSQETNGKLLARRREEIARLGRRLSVLLDMRLDGQLEPETYLKRKAQLMSEKKTVEDSIASLIQGRDTWLEPFQNWILEAQSLTQTVAAGSALERGSLAKKVFGSNLCLERQRGRGKAVEPWSYLAQRELGDTLVHLYESARTFFRDKACAAQDLNSAPHGHV